MKQDPRPSAAATRATFGHVPRSLLVILRVHLGVILLVTDLGKLTRDAPFSAEMLSFLEGYAMRNASGVYQHFLQQLVIPHATLFSYLVMAGELVAGLSLLTGTATASGPPSQCSCS
jgi:thiosulfate dehydrogenase [quinone] large subunit